MEMNVVTFASTCEFKEIKFMVIKSDFAFSILFILMIFTFDSWSQVPTEFIRPVGKDKQIESNPESQRFGDSISMGSATSRVTFKKAKITDYHYFSHLNDSVVVDTTLNLIKDLKFNYLREDDFDLMPFANMGQTYNTLSYHFSEWDWMPKFGANSKQFDFKDINDMRYYQVATPLTDLAFKTAFKQGQMLDALFTANTMKRFNYSIGYKGVRSLGNYQHALTSAGFFRFTAHYTNPNKRYHFKAHVAMQDILNQENGGISNEDLINFENGDPEFIDRAVFDPLFEDAQAKLIGKRFYLNQNYVLVRPKDSLTDRSLVLSNTTFIDNKNYEFTQASPYDAYGSVTSMGTIKDQNYLKRFYTDFNVSFSSSALGRLKGALSLSNYSNGHENLFIDENTTGSEVVKGSLVALNGSYDNQIGRFELQSKAGVILSGNESGYRLDGNLSFKWNDKFSLKAGAYSHSVAPGFNLQNYRSGYTRYNWTTSLNNQKTNGLYFEMKAPELIDIKADASVVNDYFYFGKVNGLNDIKPMQYGQSIFYLRIKASREDRFGKFFWNNTLRYQNTGDQTFLNVPDWQVRSTFYFSDEIFDKAMVLQTGITLNMFSSYHMNGYDPVLSEFFSQNTETYGGFPRLDFFVNAKVRQTRIFLKAEHFNSAWTGYNYYSAPNHPYRDFTVRFGLVWNFFL